MDRPPDVKKSAAQLGSETRWSNEILQESGWLANFISPRTKETYALAVRQFMAFTGLTRAEELLHIDQAHIIAWRNHLIEKGASPHTVNTRISAVSSLFKHFCAKQLAQKNPTNGVKRLRLDDHEARAPVLTAKQVRKMLDLPDTQTLKGLRDRAILHILFYTGCRISEISLLRVKHFFEDIGYWVLNFVVKGDKLKRLAIHHELKIALQQYLSMAGHGHEQESPLILPVQRAHLRRPLKRKQIHNIFQHYARLAELPHRVRPHSARATFIANALENDAKIEAVQHCVGHRKLNTTQMYDKRRKNHRENASFAVQW